VATTTSTVPPAAPQHTAVKAATKVRSEKKPDKTRRSAPKAPSTPSTDAPSAPVTTLPPSIQPDLATLGSTTQQLAESVRLIQAQQQMILDSQRLQEQRRLCLHLPRKPDPLSLPLRTTQFQRLHQHPFLFLRHHHREDPDPGRQEDHVPFDRLH
jgi:hypothetical protein